MPSLWPHQTQQLAPRPCSLQTVTLYSLLWRSGSHLLVRLSHCLCSGKDRMYGSDNKSTTLLWSLMIQLQHPSSCCSLSVCTEADSSLRSLPFLLCPGFAVTHHNQRVSTTTTHSSLISTISAQDLSSSAEDDVVSLLLQLICVVTMTWTKY